MTSSTVPAATLEEAFAVFHEQVASRLQAVADDAARGGLDAAIDLVVDSIRRGGVLQAFGTGHSQAFAMEIAGRAGGFIPTNMMALRDIVLRGSRDASVLTGSSLERDESVVDELFALSRSTRPTCSSSRRTPASTGRSSASPCGPRPRVTPSSRSPASSTPRRRHPSTPADSGSARSRTSSSTTGRPTATRRSTVPGGVGVGAVSSITAAYIAQLITIGAAERIAALGDTPPIYLSANIPGGDEHNHALEDRYGDRIRRTA